MRNNSPGFTLLELMIVVAVIAILSAVAYPSYMSQVARSGRNVAKADLMELQQWMERNYTITNDYRNTCNSAGCSVAVDKTKLPFNTSSRSGKKYYDIDFTATPTQFAYTLKATAIASQASKDPKCVDLSLASDGTQGISGTGTVAECWSR